MIVSALSEIQDRYGYLPRQELEFLALRTGTPLYRIQEVSTFFPHFRREPPPQATVQVCQSMSCHLRGAAELLNSTRAQFQEEIKLGKLEIEGVSCLGRCDIAPVACVRAGKPESRGSRITITASPERKTSVQGWRCLRRRPWRGDRFLSPTAYGPRRRCAPLVAN